MMGSLRRQGQRGLIDMRLMAWLSVAVFLAFAAGCDKSQQTAKPLPPVSINSGDECHVCGMSIINFPGPKGEAYVQQANKPFKFCSTRDLFSWLLQPENKIAATSVYVHDMGKTDWLHPTDSAFINARTAWYVIDQPLQGAMGPTLASFAKKSTAEAFITKHGGRLIRFEDITLKLLADLKGGDTTLNKNVR